MMPQSALHSSAEPGYQFGGQLPVPPAQPAWHAGEVVIACRSVNTDMIVH
jgi:hypothetical protein